MKRLSSRQSLVGKKARAGPANERAAFGCEWGGPVGGGPDKNGPGFGPRTASCCACHGETRDSSYANLLISPAERAVAASTAFINVTFWRGMFFHRKMNLV
jgi:hypothetical protein